MKKYNGINANGDIMKLSVGDNVIDKKSGVTYIITHTSIKSIECINQKGTVIFTGSESLIKGKENWKITDPDCNQWGRQLCSSKGLKLNLFEFSELRWNGSQADISQLGITVIPNDELHLVFEYFPTAADFTNGYVSYIDDYPDSLAQSNTPLYTNPVTGQGISQSNDIPPYARDLTLFYNYTFFT